ncbi:hypothetical protein BC830DRAFT_230852 [Chytriomyces sp. MP71]|nr:hypothetical protein BC830DRAFT_230852 [Chytriomyces sp. MP71]
MQPCGVCQESQTVVHQMELQAQVLRAKAASLSSNIQDLVAPPKTPTLATLSREAGLSAVSSPACSVLSTSSSSGSGSVAADDTIQSSFKLFGPLLGSDMAIQKLKALPSLRNSCNVDTAIGLYRELSYVTNKRTLRKYFLKMLSTRYAMFDSCNVLDRSKAVEIVYMLGQQNKRHSTHFFSFVHEMGSADDIGLSTSMTASDKAIVMLSIQTFISSIKQLPSLFGADTLIQELEQALVAVTENAGNRPLFYKTIELINQAEDICDSADRIKYVISLEIMRATTRSHVEKHMLQSAQDEFDEE